MHVENLEVLLLDLDNNSNSLCINLYHISEAVLTKTVNTGCSVCAQLKIPGKGFKFVHCQVTEQNDHVFFHSDNEASVSFMSASNDPHMVTLKENIQVFNKYLKSKLEIPPEIHCNSFLH